MTINLDTDHDIKNEEEKREDKSDINITLLKEIRCDLNNYVTNTYSSLKKDKLIENTYDDIDNKNNLNNVDCTNRTYVDNSVFINSPNYYNGVMPWNCNGIIPWNYNTRRNSSDSKSSSENNSKSNIITIIFTIIFSTLMLIVGISIFFQDPYVQFLMSGINKKFKKIHNESILKSYKNWKKKFINRTFTKLLIKIGTFVSIFITILVMIFDIEKIVPYLIISCIGIVILFVQYCINYFNDKEVKLYLELLSSIDVFVSKKAQ